ncbi:MAG: FAD-dependent oxidoreductase [Longimicrobiales bacterium]
MERNLQSLASQDFDVIVVGGGIAGISVARDAALRGLSVALVERDDFASGSTGHTSGMIHGGIRCLQRLDVGRLRALSAERNALLRNASHLLHPVPIAVPTYGRGRDGRSALNAGFGLYDFLTRRRNDGIADASRRLPRSRIINRGAVLEMFPGLPEAGLTGAAIFTETQMHHPARLALALLRSAVDAGTQAANGLEATGLVRKGITITGVGVRATKGADSFVIQGRHVVNTTGAWAARILEEGLGITLDPPLAFSRRLSFVVNRRTTHRIGLALLDESRDSQTPLSRSKHHLFMLPWRDHTVLGDWHRDFTGTPDEADVTDAEVETLVGEINERYPDLRLHPDEVLHRNAALGLLESRRSGTRRRRDAAQARLVDHAVVHGTRGITSLVGATWGTARLDAVRVVDDVFRRNGKTPPPSRTSTVPVYGGDLESLEALVREAHEAALPLGLRLSRDQAQALTRNHGTAYGEVFDIVREDRSLTGCLPGTQVLRAEIVHAVRLEMAMTLDDVVHRRTDLGLGMLSKPAIEEAAHLMGVEFGWTPDRARRELADVTSRPGGGPPAAAEYAHA